MNQVRAIDHGMGQAVAERTYLRPYAHNWTGSNPTYLNPKDPDLQRWFQILTNGWITVLLDDSAPIMGRAPERDKDYIFESWEQASGRVSFGNASLHPSGEKDRFALREAIEKAILLPAGRHLQHGDVTQPTRPQMVFTNCSTAASAWSRYYLLLNGSGVGRSIDDDLLIVDWDMAPAIQCVLDESHQDFQWGGLFLSRQEAQHRFGHGERVVWHEVEDSREGWARALEIWEMMAYERVYSDYLLVLDFSKVRPAGAPIRGMQGRPSSGPVPTMAAFHKASAGIGGGHPLWLSTLYVEHYFSESVLVGGARRASGMITKYWKDRDIMRFIGIKMVPQYRDLSPEEIIAYRQKFGAPVTTPLWTSNHSVAVDDEFWWLNSLKRGDDGYRFPLARQARNVLKAVCETSYATGSGEPGIVNVSKLNVTRKGMEDML